MTELEKLEFLINKACDKSISKEPVRRFLHIAQLAGFRSLLNSEKVNELDIKLLKKIDKIESKGDE